MSPEDVQERLAEAAETIRRLPAIRGPAPLRSHWPDFLRAYSESYDSDAERAELWRGVSTRTVASPAQIDRMEESIEWLKLVEPDDLRKLVWLRSDGLPWWRMELRRWRFKKYRRQYDRTTLRWWFKRGLNQIAVAVDPRPSHRRRSAGT